MSNVPVVTLDDKIDNLANAMLQMPQTECPVVHRFGPGVYIREITIPTGNVIIGHYHKTEHLNIMLQGRMIVLNEDGSKTELKAPLTFMAKPGRKVAIILETVVFQNVFATNETDIETLESTYLDKSMLPLEHQTNKTLLLAYDKADEVADYFLAIQEFGMSHEQVRSIVEREDDVIPFPFGGYKVMVSDSEIDGKGLFATGNFKSGEIIAPARIGPNRTPAGRYTNHSRTPNAMMTIKDNGDLELVAIRDITGMQGGYLGEEITIDYRQAMRINIKEINKCPQHLQ